MPSPVSTGGMLVLLVLFSCLATPARTAVPPHIVMVVADDLGWGDVGWNNPDMADVTQELSRLAGDGLVLDQHYTQAYLTH